MKTIRWLAAFATSLVCSAASAAPILLTFEGVANTASVNNYYGGGSDSTGKHGINYGVKFSNASLGLVDADKGGTGNFANEPSDGTILFFFDSSAIMNVAAGFRDEFSFYYSSFRTGYIKVFDGMNGNGNLLLTINLKPNVASCNGDPTGEFCRFDRVNVNFAGMARSVDFGGAANRIAFDNITLGAEEPDAPQSVPEPGSLALLGLGLAGLALRRRKPA